jgi:hypothetical protein
MPAAEGRLAGSAHYAFARNQRNKNVSKIFAFAANPVIYFAPAF